jgi:hypothetical protein
MRSSALVLSVLALTLSACSDAPAPRGEPVDIADAADLLESTPWLDTAPRSERDKINAYVFQDGQGLFYFGNSYKATIELFEYDLDGDKLVLEFLDERKTYKTAYKIERHRGEIFDYKLTIKKAPRGPKVYYGFASDHAMPALVSKIKALAPRP